MHRNIWQIGRTGKLGNTHGSPERPSESRRAELWHVSVCGSCLDESSQSVRLNGAEKIQAITHHRWTITYRSMLITSSSSPSKSLISDFLLTLLPLGAVFHFSKTATCFLSLHSQTDFFFYYYLFPSLSLSPARCCLSVCGWGERLLEQNESHLLALCPHRHWLHTLRCEITS